MNVAGDGLGVSVVVDGPRVSVAGDGLGEPVTDGGVTSDGEDFSGFTNKDVQ